ncbi:MAG: hypothetical protein MZV64_05110 [Ignavibacteriales bacterium]|nr:hypothetical protein [Ignavibacteriales bacterium]
MLTGHPDAGQGATPASPTATILLIVVAFLVARAVVKCGLGRAPGPPRREPVRRVDARACPTASSWSTASSRPRSRATPRAAACSTRWWSAWPRRRERRPGTPAGGGWAAT